MQKKDKNLSSLITCLWVLACGIALVIFLMSTQEHPDDIRKNGMPLDGIVTRVSETVSNRMGNDSGGYYVHTKITKEDNVLKEDHAFSVGISLYQHFSVGDDVKIWDYKDVFYLDEYDNMQPQNVWPLVLAEVICLSLIIYLYLIRRKKENF